MKTGLAEAVNFSILLNLLSIIDYCLSSRNTDIFFGLGMEGKLEAVYRRLGCCYGTRSYPLRIFLLHTKASWPKPDICADAH